MIGSEPDFSAETAARGVQGLVADQAANVRSAGVVHAVDHSPQDKPFNDNEQQQQQQACARPVGKRKVQEC